MNQPDLDKDESVRQNEAFLANELAHLEKTQARDHKDLTRTSLAYQGEKLGGAWSAINKERKPWDLIHRLKIPYTKPLTYEQESRHTAELAHKYHNDLQNEGLRLPPNSPEYARKTKAILNEIPASQKLPDLIDDESDWEIIPEQVKKSNPHREKQIHNGS